MLVLLRLATRLPLSWLYVLGYASYRFSYDILRWRRGVSLTNLRNAFPDKTEHERRRIARLSYRNLGDLLAEVLKGATLTKEEIRQRVRILNPQLITRFTGQGQSVVLLASHHCNWEWLLLAASVQLDIPIDAVYKPQRVAAIDRFLREARSRFGGNPIPHKQFLLAVRKRKGSARAFALVADQTPGKSDEKHWTRFLNQDTAFFVGAEKLARITRSPVIFVGMQRLSRGHYEARLKLLAAPPYSRDSTDIIERYAREVEAQIIASPTDFLWLHRKWKYKKPAYR